MQNYKLISKITLWVLLAIGIIVSLMFYAGGSQGALEVAGDFLDIPKHTDLMLNWNYILLFLACVATLFFVCVEFVKTLQKDPKKSHTPAGRSHRFRPAHHHLLVARQP